MGTQAHRGDGDAGTHGMGMQAHTGRGLRHTDVMGTESHRRRGQRHTERGRRHTGDRDRGTQVTGT
jgi:hypothetical protein